MKRKIYKIMGVALTLVMVLSLFAFAAPVAADPDENEWSKFSYPDEGSGDDWFYNPDIDYVGPIAMTVDGEALYCAAYDGSEYHLFKSEDDGRTWSKTDYYADLYDDYGADQIVDIACDSEDADVVYVADANYVYWTEDGGDKWTAVAPESWVIVGAPAAINSLDVGYIGGDPFVFVSTGNGSYNGSVYFINQEDYLAGWINMDTQSPYSGYDVYAVNVAPDFEDSHKIFAVITAATPRTLIVTNTGTEGAWSQFGGDFYLVTGPPSSSPIKIEAASDICFPGDFDDDELLVGVSGAIDGTGSVYRVIEDIAYAYRLGNYDSTVDVDIISLDMTGDVGATLLLAGAQDYNADIDDSVDVFYSTDDGEGWDAAGKLPTGDNGMAYVLMAEDFADSGIAWAATSGDECAVSYTIDGGDLWNQISLIDTNMDGEILSFSFYPDYEDSGKLFMVTNEDYGDESLWRYDGEYWERVALDNAAVGDALRWVEVSPEIGNDETVYLTNWPMGGSPDIYRSTDEGQSWDDLRCQPNDFYGGIVIDEDTVLVGGSGEVFLTDDHGNRVWDTIGADIDGDIYWFARYGDNVLCASLDGEVALSEDLGESWEELGDGSVISTGGWDDMTYVAFDTEYDENSFVYAACADSIYRFEVGESDNWKDIDDGVTVGGSLSGIATADGCLYVSDKDAGAGMWRSVDPTASSPLFEQVDFELGAGAELWWLKTTSGSNVLYALDSTSFPFDNTEIIWTYEDALVGPVVLDSPADGEGVDRTNKLTLAWEGLDDADDYEVKCYADEDFRGAYRVWNADIDDDEPLLVLTEGDGIEPGTAYWWKVRVAEGEPLVSKWSVVWSATTAMGAAQWNPFSGPVNEYPWMGATNVPLAPTFAWNVADWASGYEFELADNDAFSDAFTKTLTTTVYQYETDLAYFTTYYWKVRAVSATGTSNWATGVFTTMERPAEIIAPPPPVQIPPTPAPITPAWIWAIVVIGAVLVVAVIVLIVMTRRVP